MTIRDRSPYVTTFHERVRSNLPILLYHEYVRNGWLHPVREITRRAVRSILRGGRLGSGYGPLSQLTGHVPDMFFLPANRKMCVVLQHTSWQGACAAPLDHPMTNPADGIRPTSSCLDCDRAFTLPPGLYKLGFFRTFMVSPYAPDSSVVLCLRNNLEVVMRQNLEKHQTYGHTNPQNSPPRGVLIFRSEGNAPWTIQAMMTALQGGIAL